MSRWPGLRMAAWLQLLLFNLNDLDYYYHITIQMLFVCLLVMFVFFFDDDR